MITVAKQCLPGFISCNHLTYYNILLQIEIPWNKIACMWLWFLISTFLLHFEIQSLCICTRWKKKMSTSFGYLYCNSVENFPVVLFIITSLNTFALITMSWLEANWSLGVEQSKIKNLDHSDLSQNKNGIENILLLSRSKNMYLLIPRLAFWLWFTNLYKQVICLVQIPDLRISMNENIRQQEFGFS